MIVTTWVPQPVKQRTLKDVPSSLDIPVLCWLTSAILGRLYTVPNPDTTKPPLVRRVAVDGDTDTLSNGPEYFALYEPEAPQIRTRADVPLFRIIKTTYDNAWAKISPTEWVRSVDSKPFQLHGYPGPDGTFTVTDYEVTIQKCDLSEPT